MNKECPATVGKIEVLKVDVSNDASVTSAATALTGKLGGTKLYGLVNNAGIGWGNEANTIMNTNDYGVKRMTEAFLLMLDATSGRVVHLGSGAGPMFVKK